MSTPPRGTLYLMPTRRRTFLQQVALAAAAPQAPSLTPPPAPGIPYPRAFTERHLTAIAFPVGAVAAASLSLGGRGQLRDWESFNRSNTPSIR